MSVVELSDEENVAILAETFTDSLADLRDKTRQLAVLKRLSALLNSSAPQHYIYETVQGCEELEVIRVGDDRRIFCKLVMGVPEDDARYNVLFVFYVDPPRVPVAAAGHVRRSHRTMTEGSNVVRRCRRRRGVLVGDERVHGRSNR